MATTLINVGFDTVDPVRLGRWWAQALGWTVTVSTPEETAVESPGHRVGDAFPELEFIAVPPVPRTGPVGIHLDLASGSTAAQQATVSRLLAAGATRADNGQPADAEFVALKDPEGNEFCVLEPRDVYEDTGPIAAIVVNSTDPAALADFWESASGWRRVGDADGLVQFRHPDGGGPFLELGRVGEERPEKLRVHLDVAPPPDGDQAAEIERCVPWAPGASTWASSTGTGTACRSHVGGHGRSGGTRVLRPPPDGIASAARVSAFAARRAPC